MDAVIPVPLWLLGLLIGALAVTSLRLLWLAYTDIQDNRSHR